MHYEGVEEISVDNGGKKGKGKTWAAVVNLFSISGALATVRYIHSLDKYDNVEIFFGADECAQSGSGGKLIQEMAERATRREQHNQRTK